MGYCVANCDILLCVIVWRVVLFCYGLLCGERWYFFMGYCVASGGISLWVIVWREVVFCYGLLCGQWWYLLTDVSGTLSVYLQEACFPEIYIRNYILHVKCFSTVGHILCPNLELPVLQHRIQ